ncbi:MAG: hypothetical protein IIA90_02655 [Chloroflexi bacterium]|nr:hypothetical protein [Chloroflexota bacterium]
MRNLALVVDSDAIERRYVSAAMAADGFHVVQVGRVVEAMVFIRRLDPALVIGAEEDLEAFEPYDVVAILRGMTSAPLMILGDEDMPAELRSLTEGADFYLRRPFTALQLLLRARTLLRRSAEEGATEAASLSSDVLRRLTLISTDHPATDWEGAGIEEGEEARFTRRKLTA